MSSVSIPAQFGFTRAPGSSAYQVQRAASIRNNYQSGENPMATRQTTVPWDLFKWVVGGLLGVLVLLVGAILATFRSDLGDVRTKLDGVTTQIHQNHVELIKSVSAIGGKLDQMTQDMRRR
jgi:hypothetical protein